MDENKALIYRSIFRFLKAESEQPLQPSSVSESVEVARQCLANALEIPEDGAYLDLDDIVQTKKFTIRRSYGPVSDAIKEETEALKNQGNQYMKDEKFDEAIASYTSAIEKAPGIAVYYCNRAAAYSKVNKHDESIKDCMDALEIDPNYSKAYGRMGLAYSNLNDHQKAVDAYQKAWELDPNNENCKQNLQIAKNRLQSSSTQNVGDGFARMFGAEGMDFSAMLSNPLMQNIARQVIADPNMQNLMTNLLSNAINERQQNGDTGDPTEGNADNANTEGQTQPDFSEILRVGQQLAQQMQDSNSDLIDQLRQNYYRDGQPGQEDRNAPSEILPDSNETTNSTESKKKSDSSPTGGDSNKS